MDTPDKKVDEFYLQALMLSEVVKRILKQKAEMRLSRKPVLELTPISEFMKRMRVSSFEKFDETTYISTVNFYATEQDLQINKSLGAIIVYIPESFLVYLFNDMGYPSLDEDDQDAMEDACGTFCNLVAGNFKAGLTQLGYKELVMSHFSSFTNEIINGVDFDPAQTEKYEIRFEVAARKSIFVDLTLATIPKEESI